MLIFWMLLGALALAVVASAPASALMPAWHLYDEGEPTNIPPGGQGEVVVMASDVGAASVNGSAEPVSITFKLPSGLSAGGITGTGCSLPTLTCTFKGVLNPYQAIQIKLKVKADPALGPVSTEPIAASVEGGGAPKFSGTLPVSVNSTPAAFGTSTFELLPLNEDGTAATAAGSHPFQLTTTLVLNQEAEEPIEMPKDLNFRLPPGLVGNPNAVTQCTMADFFALVKETNLCPVASVVGVATVTVTEPKVGPGLIKTVPVFNLAPSQGEPARFGFEVIGKVPIVIDTSVRTGTDYGVNVSVRNATETGGLLSSQVTFWGVPGDPRHDNVRGWECVAGGEYAGQVGKSCPGSSGLAPEPFLTLPGSCAADPEAEPVVFSLDLDSWTHPEALLGIDDRWVDGEARALGFQGCNSLPFNPSISVVPEQHTTSTPTGLTIDVKVPQQTTLETSGLAEADVRATTVALPKGVELSPVGRHRPCGVLPGTGRVPRLRRGAWDQRIRHRACRLPGHLEARHGEDQDAALEPRTRRRALPGKPRAERRSREEPLNSLVAVYLVAQDPVSGVLVKLAGEGQIDEGTLQISTTFKNTPQVPFDDLKIELLGGPRASVTNPARCGAYSTDASFVPWSGTALQNVLGPGGRICHYCGRRRIDLSGGSAALRTGVPGGQHKRPSGGLHSVLSGTEPSRRRSGALCAVDAPAHGDGGEAVFGAAVSGGAGGRKLVSPGQRNRACDGCGGSRPRTLRTGRWAGVHHRSVWWGAVRVGDRDAGQGGAVRPRVRDRPQQAVHRPA